jgi:carbohydrate kinase (thermoresistant glucokinase family)
MPVVVMGVSGSGKSSVGSALARAMSRDFVDGDDLHPASNVEKMRSGHPLDDVERAPWLGAIAAVLADHASHRNGIVVACSALKRAHRDALRCVHGLQFVFLDADRPLIERRFAERRGHFMPGSLIASQFDALERPSATERDVLTIDAALPVDVVVRTALELIDARCSAAQSNEDWILRSWHSNAAPWARAIREQRIASRTLVTNRAILDAVLALPARRVLDLGCGEGWLARALSAEGVAVTGVDAVVPLIAEARRLGGAAFSVCSYADLAEGRLEPRDFDAAVCNFSLFGEDSVERLLGRTLRRYLAPSAHLIIQTLHPLGSCGNEGYRDGWRPGNWWGFDRDFNDPAPWYFRTLGSWLALLRSCGYQLVDCREPTAPDAQAPSSVIFVARALPAG